MRLRRQVLTRKLRKYQAEKVQIGTNFKRNDQFFDQNSYIFVLPVFFTLNFKKIGGSKHEIFKKLDTGILISLRNFWASNSKIRKNAEPDPLTLDFL